jgi:hypothetical protein
MNLESAFAKALGRAPTRDEAERLRRLRDAFGIRDNDALWIIVLVLERYDALYRTYPDETVRAVEKTLRTWRNQPLESALPGPTRELCLVTLVGFLVAFSVLLGAASMALGAMLQSRGTLPCWAFEGTSIQGHIISVVLGAPAGWIVFLVLIVPALYAGGWGWGRAKDAKRTLRERMLGAAGVAALLGVIVGWLMLLGSLRMPS